MSRACRAAALAVAFLLPVSLVAPAVAHAQSLRGSKDKVDRAYQFAKRRGIEFTTSRADIREGVEEGDYVRLGASRNVRLKGVAVPYVRPATRAFVETFSARYRRACGQPLVVTSAMRPTALQRQLPNGVAKSVHPTGMAIDLRAPTGSCRSWLRRELLAESRRGAVDATEEHHPAHFHVIVFRAP